MLMLDDREALCHLALQHGPEGSDHLLNSWVLMEYTPERHVVVCNQFHQLMDDGLALLLVIVVSHYIKHTVQEGNGRLNLPDDLEDLAPAFSYIHSLTQPDNLELLVRLAGVYIGQTTDSVLDGDCVILTHLSVDVEYDRLRHILQLISKMAKLTF